LKLDKWAQVAEVIGSFAIVVTLIILIVEVRSNTEAVTAASRQSIASRTEQIALTVAGNTELAELLANNSEFESSERLRLAALLTALLRNAEEAYLQWEDGRLDQDYLDRRLSGVLSFVRSGLMRDVYLGQKRSGTLDQGFTDYLDRAVTERFGN